MDDAVDAVIAQWARARPDLVDSLPAMATIGRVGRVAAYFTKRIEGVAARFGLDLGCLDVLFALRRSGEPFELTPSYLARTMMLSPAGATSRLDRLERDGLVERRLDPNDRRSFRVRLTEEGRELADAVVVEHLATENELLAPLSVADRRSLDRSLRKLLLALEGGGPGSPG